MLYQKLIPLLLFCLTSPLIAGSISYEDIKINADDLVVVIRESGDSLNTAGIQDFGQGKYDEALLRFQEAITLYQKIDFQKGIVSALLNMALVYDAEGLKSQAESNVENALRISRLLKYPRGEAEAAHKLGTLAFSHENYDAAISNFKKAGILYSSLKDNRNSASVKNSLGICYQNLNRLAEAEVAFASALDNNKKIKNYSGMSANYLNLASVYVKKNTLKKALIYAKKSLFIDSNLEDVASLGIILNTLGDISEKLNDIAQANFYFERAYQVNKALGLDRRLITDLENVIRTAKALQADTAVPEKELKNLLKLKVFKTLE